MATVPKIDPRSSSPESLGDTEKGYSVFNPIQPEKKVEVVVHKTPPVVKKPTGLEIFTSALQGPRIAGRKRTRKHKKRAHKKTQKRRARK